MPEKTLNARDGMLVQWLGEAHAKEAELEADLTAHIALTTKTAYKKRLQDHLKETREHKRAVAKRIRALGAKPTDAAQLPGVPTAVTESAGKAVAAVKGQVGAVRALVTEQAQTHMRNAQEELREEHVEIAIYTRLEALAEAVGDNDTAKLARGIRRDEERMAKFLSAELGRLVREVVRADIPADQRAKPTRARRPAARRAASPRKRSTASPRKRGTAKAGAAR